MHAKLRDTREHFQPIVKSRREVFIAVVEDLNKECAAEVPKSADGGEEVRELRKAGCVYDALTRCMEL